MHISLVCYCTRSNPRIIGGTKPRHNMHKQQQGQLTQIIPSIKGGVTDQGNFVSASAKIENVLNQLAETWLSKQRGRFFGRETATGLELCYSCWHLNAFKHLTLLFSDRAMKEDSVLQ